MVVLPKEIGEIVKSPEECFKQDPLSMLKVVRFSCEAEFDADKAVGKAILSNASKLEEIPPENLREDFEAIIASKNPRKGLELLTKLKLINHIVGEEIANKMSRKEMEDFTCYIENINKTKQVRLRRMALFFKCFEDKKAENAIRRLKFDPEDEGLLLDGIYLLDKLYFLTNKYEFKKFLVEYGMERYEFLENLAKAQRLVYDLSVNRIESRRYILDNIKEFKEPIFEEDLAITREELLEKGIINGENADKIMGLLVDMVHMKPNFNTKEDMTEYARKFSKSRLAAAMRKIKFIR